MVKFLLQRQQWREQQQRGESSGDAYVNATGHGGLTPIYSAVVHCKSFAPKVVRLLVDAGADTTFPVRMTEGAGGEAWSDTPLGYVYDALKYKHVGATKATEQQLNALEAIHRLLLRVEAAHGVSWPWPDGTPSVPEDDSTAEEASRTTTPSTP
eukprot:g21100.t1